MLFAEIDAFLILARLTEHPNSGTEALGIMSTSSQQHAKDPHAKKTVLECAGIDP